MTTLFAAVHEFDVGTSRTSQDVQLESAKWGKADIDQVVVTNRNCMSTRPDHGRGRGSSCAGRMRWVSSSISKASATRSIAMARRVAAQSLAADCTTAATTSGKLPADYPIC